MAIDVGWRRQAGESWWSRWWEDVAFVGRWRWWQLYVISLDFKGTNVQFADVLSLTCVGVKRIVVDVRLEFIQFFLDSSQFSIFFFHFIP